MKYNYSIFVLLFALFSCDKTEDTEFIPQEDSEEFISGTFNGQQLYFTNSKGDDFSNAYYYDESINHDQLNLIRDSDDGKTSIQLYISGSRLKERKFPLSLSDFPACAVEIQLRDLSSPLLCFFCPEDDYNYVSRTTPRVVILDYNSEGIITGTFEGKIATNTGRKMTVKNGEFRLKIVDVYGE